MMNERQIRIRPETKSDVLAIEAVTVAAFMKADRTDHNEQFIVRSPRATNHLLISLVAEDKVTHTIIGHAAVSPVTISDGSEDWYGLGPISVLPEYQRKGLGSLFMNCVLADLQARHAAGCVVLGNPKYYARFGFRADHSMQLPGVPLEYFMALTWCERATGTVSYHKAFEARKWKQSCKEGFD